MKTIGLEKIIDEIVVSSENRLIPIDITPIVEQCKRCEFFYEIRVDGKFDEIGNLFKKATDQIENVSLDLRLMVLIPILRLSKGVKILPKHNKELSDIYLNYLNFADNVTIMLNVEKESTIPNEIQVRVLSGFIYKHKTLL